MSDEVAVFAYRRPCGRPNFGDDLGPEILSRLGYRVRRVPAADAELAACGSILHMLTNPGTAVWGCGMMSPRKRPPVRLRDIRAVRGPYTQALLSLSPRTPLGDPAILVPRLWPRARAVKHRIGMVRHYVDTNTYPWADVQISTEQGADDVIEQITSCSAICSSSLHGLITAEAFGIPAMRIAHPRVGGADAKWVDYAAGRLPHDQLAQAQDRLLKVLD